MSDWRIEKTEFIQKDGGNDKLIELRKLFSKTNYEEDMSYWIGHLLLELGVDKKELEDGRFAYHTKGIVIGVSEISEIEKTNKLTIEMELPWEIKNTFDFLAEYYNLTYKKIY